MHTPDDVRNFFRRSDRLDYLVLRPLDHIAANWELSWDHESGAYAPEPCSFAADVNQLINLVATCPRPNKYHDHEDAIIENWIRDRGWPIQKKGGRWITADYPSMLEQASFKDFRQLNLIASAAGRVHSALDFGQYHFDQMEERHRYMLAAIMSIAIYHRYSDGASLVSEDQACIDGS